MNTRIKELANKAGYNDQIFEICKEGLEKFAELVEKDIEAKHYSAGFIEGRSVGTMETARECADLVADYSKQRTHDTWYNAAEQIKSHYGIVDIPKLGSGVNYRPTYPDEE